MSSATLARLVSRCRGLSARAATAPDADLVQRFARSADPDAFAELVGRYANLVWGVCRRTLPQEADAEDAFQAVFLALARGARAIDPRRPLGAWLHAVAIRVSRRALGKTLRRRTTELPECPGPADVVRDVSSRDLFRAVDEEIARLPAALRGPVVLCCLEGRTRDEAAAVLGCSVPAVKARLERARLALRTALGRRGIALPAALFVIGLGADRVGAGLKELAVSAALGSPSPAVVRLAAAGVPIHLVRVGLALAAAVVVGVGALGLPLGQPKDAPPAAKDAPAPKAEERTAHVDKFGDPLPDGAVRRFGTLRFRHDAVAALAFTPDGKRLVAGVGRNALAVFDPADGRLLGHVGAASPNNNYGFALSPDGKHVYCTGFQLTRWDLATGKKVREFEAVRCQTVAVSPDGKAVAVAREARGGLAMLFDADTGEKLVDLNLKDLPATQWGPAVNGLAFSPDGKVVAAVVAEVKETQRNVLTTTSVGLRLWEAATGNPLATIAPAGDHPTTFAFVPGTKLIAFLGKGGAIRLWDPDAGKAVRTIPLAKGDVPRSDLHVSADGKRLALYLKAGAVAVFDRETGKEVRRFETGGPVFGPAAVGLSPDGSLVAFGTLYSGSAVRVWEVDTGRERLAGAGHRGPATLALSADGRALVSRGAGQVFRWDLATGEGNAKPDDVKDPDGQVPDPDWGRLAYRFGRYRFAIEHASGKLELRTRDGSKLVATAACPAEYVRGAAHSPDGRQVAVSFQDRGTCTVLLWKPEARAEPFRLTGHPDAVQQMAFTHDGKYLIAGAGTHNAYPTETVFVYDTATGQLVRKLNTRSAPGHLLLTADDRTLITGGLWNDATVHVWDLATGKELATLVDPAVKVPSIQPGTGEVSSIGGLALSADERFLAVITEQGDSSTVSVWDTGSWKPVRAFRPVPTRPARAPHAGTSAVAFARDGRSVFVAYADSTILEWRVAGRSAGPAPSAARLNELWQALADPEMGSAGAWELLDHPAEAVAFLKTKLTPVRPADAAAVKGLVRQLGSDVFRERAEAEKKLIALGEPALPAVRAAAAGGLSAEAKERADRVIAALTGPPTAEQLRRRRAVAVLEWSDRADADEHLRALAAGDPAARQTKDARAAVERRGRKAGDSD